MNEKGNPLFPHQSAYLKFVAFPANQAALLEALAGCYSIGKRPDDALHVWQDLYSVGTKSNFILLEGEAAHGIADIYETKKERVDAIKWYVIAADAWAKGGNTARQMDAMASEAVLLYQDQQRAKAITVEEQLRALAQINRDSRREFIYSLTLAEYLQPGADPAALSRDEKDSYRKTLLNAESLLSESLTLPGVNSILIAELCGRLAALYANDGDEIEQLVSLEKEMDPAGLTKKTDLMLGLEADIKRHIESEHLQDSAEKAYQRNDLANALLYYELLQHFQQVDAIWRGQQYNEHYDDPIVNKLVEIPFQLTGQPGGPETLERNLRHLGPIAGMVRFSTWASLTLYYSQQNQPDKVIQFASLAWPFLHLKEADSPQRHDVQIACEYSLALMGKRDVDSAVQKVSGCLSSAKAFSDPVLLLVAHQLNAEILGMAGKLDQATESVEYVRQHPFVNLDGLLATAAAQQSAGDWKSALDSLHKALEVAGSTKADAAVASIHVKIAGLISTGAVNDDVGQEGHLNQAALQYKKLGDTASLADVDLQLASLYIARRDFEKADHALQSALQIAVALKRADLEARATSLQGQRYGDAAGDPNKALVLFGKSAEIYRNRGELSKESSELLNQANVLSNRLFKSKDALTLAEQALGLAQRSKDWLQQIASLRMAGDIKLTLGDYPASLDDFRDALTISETQHWVLISAYIRLQMFEALGNMGSWESALEAVKAALPILKQFHDRNSEFAAYMELIDLYSARESDMQDLNKALELAKEMKEVLGDLSPGQSASLSMVLYEIHYQQGHFNDAIADARSSLSYDQRVSLPVVEAGALLSLAESMRSSGDLKGARDALSRAEPLVKQSGDFYLIGRYYYGQANLYRAEGKLTLAIDDYERVIGFIEQFKSRNDAPLTRAVSETYNYIYGELLDTYYMRSQVEKGYELSAASKAFEVAELNKSRTFTTTWGRSLIDALRRKLPPNLQEEEQLIVEQSAVLQNELNQTNESVGRTRNQVDSDLQRLSVRENAFKVQLRRDYPVYADARYPRQMTISDLPLRTGEVLVEFKMFKPATFVWIIEGTESGPRVLSFYKVHQSKDWFNERIEDIRDAMNRGDPDSFDPKESEELFNALFPASDAEILTSASSLIFIPDDILCLLPMEILSPRATKNDFVLIGTPTSYFSSAAGLRLSRSVRKPDTAWRSSFFGIADPITSQDDVRYKAATDLDTTKTSVAEISGSQREANRNVRFTTRGYYFDRLPETAREVDSIAALFPNSSSSTTVRTGTEATKKALLQTDLSGYRFLHFATHGFLPVESGEIEPALIFSVDGIGQDQMMLKLSEISKLPIHADLVVLSACNTGSGKVTQAEGVSSLGSAFLAAGSSSVVVSLWKVADKSTSLLMQDFYKNLLSGMPKNRALAEARKELFLEGEVHPFYWAPFVLSGE